MITKIASLTFSGIDITNVDVQVQILAGVPNFIIVGLPDKTIAESKERVRSAFTSIGLALPAKRIVVNMAPADLHKEGSHFDLAIACGILANMQILPADLIEQYLIMGELGLDGKIIPVNGALPAAIGAMRHGKGLICSAESGVEASWSGNQKILAPGCLVSLINHFSGASALKMPTSSSQQAPAQYREVAEIKGQLRAKRAMLIAACGGHNMLIFGPPGTGKSMLAERMPGVMPELSPDEILEVSMIASVAGLIKDGQLTKRRPFRAPHHTCSAAAMVGGGAHKRIRPGEISLAHNGVLFLDELPEFNGAVLEALRQPIETNEVHIARAGAHVRFPANFQLIAAMNPCKCGYLGDPYKECHRTPICGEKYRNKVSGPIYDRFDLQIEVASDHNYDYAAKSRENATPEEALYTTSNMKEAVARVRQLQLQRYAGDGIRTNSQLEGDNLSKYAMPIDDGLNVLGEAASKFRLSMRSYNRLLRVSRTIADIDGAEQVNRNHVLEALSYRQIEDHNIVT